ncbi:MAG: hypothetical protein QM730_17650 [Anaerolineales bacterium]
MANLHSHPKRVTPTVGRRVEYREFCLKVVLLGSSEQRTPCEYTACAS